MSENCMYCGTEKTSENAGHSYPPYAYNDWVCDNCWDNCPECGSGDWNHKSSRSTRKHNKKVCTGCGFSFITSPASG